MTPPKPSRAEELAIKLYDELIDIDSPGDIVQSFLAAIREYGQEVRRRDAEILRDHYWDSYANDSTVKAHSDAIAAAIAREPLP